MSERKSRIRVVAKNAIAAPSTAKSPDRCELVLYATEDGGAKYFQRVEDGTVWVARIEHAELFQSTKQNISLHIKNILDVGELEEAATVKDSLTAQTERKREVRRSVKLYKLDSAAHEGWRGAQHWGKRSLRRGVDPLRGTPPAARRIGRVAIHVDPDGRVLVDAPKTASDTQISTAVTRRAGGIHGHLIATLRMSKSPYRT